MVVEHTIDASKAIRTSMKLPLFPILFILLTLSPSLSRMDGKSEEDFERRSGKISFQPFGYQSLRRQRCQPDFHDAVRPLVSQRILNDVIKALETYAAIDVAMPATDTIIEVDGDFIHQIPDRSKLKRGQTPQAFHLETISHAYEIALKDEHFKVTDDCGVVVKYLPDVPVYVVTGEESNMKLTYKEDTYLLDKFFQLRKSELNEIPLNESQLKGKVAVIFGGSYGIGEHTARMLQEKQAKVFCFSRSMNGVDVGKKEQVADALKKYSYKPTE